MRVGVFCPTLDVYGGAEYVAVTIANALARSHYDVTLFVNNPIEQQKLQYFFGTQLDRSMKIIVKPTVIRPKYLLDFYQTIFRSYCFKLKCDLWIDVYSNRLFPWTDICYIHFPFANRYDYNEKFPYLKSRRIIQVSALPYVLIEKNLVSEKGKLILANSKYTAQEIEHFLGKRAEVLYPPVSAASFCDLKNLIKNKRKNLVVTVSRFAPTKELEKIPYIASLTDSGIKFAVLGRIYKKDTFLSLQKLTKELGLMNKIEFFPNISKSEIKEILKTAKCYLHTMTGEHFGISIVEAMASGCIPVVHNSGGPREFVPEGLRYNTLKEAAEKIENEVYSWSPRKAIQMIKIAENFKEENFVNRFIELFNRYKVSFLEKNGHAD